jgi:hypothetical protein
MRTPHSLARKNAGVPLVSSAWWKIRLSAEERAAWEVAAGAAGLTVSAYVRRCVSEAIALERAVARADQEADRRAARLARLTPPEIDELRRRYPGDWGAWPIDGDEA